MCELLAASFPEPQPFAFLADAVAGLEEYGLGSFGWGVAWLGDGAVYETRGLGRFRDEGLGDVELLEQSSRRFLVHLRRPSKLSTVQMADTQPFLNDGCSAWCHNGFLERADALRDNFKGRLKGEADSEVGWIYFLDRMEAGADCCTAFADVDGTFGGHVNLGYLGSDGELAVYSRNSSNRMWHFRLGDVELASTDLHSADDSVFDLVFPAATDRELIEPGTALRLAGSRLSTTESKF